MTAVTAQIHRAGFALVHGVLNVDECDGIAVTLAGREGGLGQRSLLQEGWCVALAQRLRAHPALGPVLSAYRAVQCNYFEKSAKENWLVAVHQDLSIPVAARVCNAALRAWSSKEGLQFVQPPVDVLEQLVAVRVHVDRCGGEDGPLRVVPGSHCMGVIAPDVAVEARRRGVTCAANRGDVLVMKPLLLHMSSKSRGSGLRRVLHFVFGPPRLPHGLVWATAI
jgi:Phytanoyl-CoA dioxygenase (PhyH)